MLILAFETATVPGSAALARDGEVIGEIELPRDKYISEALLPAIDGLLGRAGVGPGTWTSWRLRSVRDRSRAFESASRR